MANHDRIDAALYQDFESAEARGKRQAKEAKEMERLEKAAAKVVALGVWRFAASRLHLPGFPCLLVVC